MFEVASTILDLITNLLDPMGYVVGVIANLQGCHMMTQRAVATSRRGDGPVLQVRIQMVDCGRVPDYRIEYVDRRDPDNPKVVCTFDGATHTPLTDLRPKSIDCDAWSDTPTPAADVEKLLVILRRFGGRAGISPVPTPPN